MNVDYEDYKELHELFIRALAGEREKADNLFKVARKHSVENQELKKQLSTERGKRKAAEAAVFAARMLDEQQVVEATKQLRNQLDAAVEALKAVRANLAGANKNDSRIAYIDTVLTKLLDAATDERDQLRQQLAAATAREFHSYDVAKFCREQLAAAVEALEKALAELEDPSEYLGEVQDGYSPGPKVIESIRQTLAKLREGNGN